MRLLIYFLLYSGLAGCGRDTPQAVLDNYLERVASTLEQPLPELITARVQALPARRERRLPVVEVRAGILDALDLGDCGLLPLIAERNSILGKVKPPSAVMRYEFQFFALLDACYRRDQRNPINEREFSIYLAEIYRTKRKNLSAIVWNALFTSAELEANLSLAKDPLPLLGNPGYGDSLRALQALDRYRQAVLSQRSGAPFRVPPANQDLENHYFALYRSTYGGQLFSSLRLLTAKLNQAATLIDRTLEHRPFCLSGRPTPKAQYLKNVFTQFYAGEVQPYLAMVHRQGEPWLTLMAQLAAPLDGESGPLDDYRQRMLSTTAPDSLWSQYQRSLQRHTESWQRVLHQCGLMPTAS